MAFFSRNRPAQHAELSIYDPIHLGVDPFGEAVTLQLAWRNCLVGGQPGAGKSALLSNVLGHAALCLDVDLVLIDGKDIELPHWEALAVEQVGRDINAAIDLLTRLDVEMTEVYAELKAAHLTKVPRSWRRQRLDRDRRTGDVPGHPRYLGRAEGVHAAAARVGQSGPRRRVDDRGHRATPVRGRHPVQAA